MKKIFVSIMFTILMTITGCGVFDNGLNNSDNNSDTTNHPPSNQYKDVVVKYEIDGLNVKFFIENKTGSEIISYTWDFGDGETSFTENPTHNYLNSGNYKINVKLIFSDGTEETIKHEITVQENKPVNASITYNISGLNVNFNVNYNNSHGVITSYKWEFGDGNSSNIHAPTHIYNSYGTYQVTLKITFADGSSLNLSETITLNNSTQPEDKVELQMTHNISDLTVNFHVTDNGKYGNMQSWIWDFGDGNTANTQSPVHTYQAYNNYTVSVEVTYDNGKKDGVIKEIVIEKPTIDTSALKEIFLQGFGSDKTKMYYAIHINGISSKGKFKQQVGSKSAYVRDLAIQPTSNVPDKAYKFSSSYESLGLKDVYSVDYGWSDLDGVELDMKFYLGDASFNVPMNQPKINIFNFVMMDYTTPGILDGNVSFIRCNTSGGVSTLNFNIPYDRYDPNIHENIALFTISFDGDKLCHQPDGFRVTFDGFKLK